MKSPANVDSKKNVKPRRHADASDAPKAPRKGEVKAEVKGKENAKAKAKAGKGETPAPEAKAEAAPRVKLVRDSFTMPRDEFELIAKLKARALEFKRPTKKSELLRAGLQQLAALNEGQLRSALAALRPLPTGRPKKSR